MAAVTLRLARLEDAAGIAGVLRDLGWFEHITAESLATTTQRVASQLAACADGASTVLVAERDSVVVGYLAAHWFPNLMRGAEGYISELFLSEAARGQGIGGRLLAAIESEARDRGADRLILFNRKERESWRRGFYVKHGWEAREDSTLFMRWLGE